VLHIGLKSYDPEIVVAFVSVKMITSAHDGITSPGPTGIMFPEHPEDAAWRSEINVAVGVIKGQDALPGSALLLPPPLFPTSRSKRKSSTEKPGPEFIMMNSLASSKGSPAKGSRHASTMMPMISGHVGGSRKLEASSSSGSAITELTSFVAMVSGANSHSATRKGHKKKRGKTSGRIFLMVYAV
jgi:hypothetical protein